MIGNEYLATAIACSLVVAVSNMIRGSENDTGLPWFRGKVFNASFWAGAVYMMLKGIAGLSTFTSISAAVLSVPAMLGAMSFGWGEYVGAQLINRHRTDKEIGLIDDIMAPFEDNPRIWGLGANTLRGLLGGAILALPFAIVQEYTIGMAVLFGFSLMGVAFGIASLFPRAISWKVGEFFMGLFIGLGLFIGSLKGKHNANDTK